MSDLNEVDTLIIEDHAVIKLLYQEYQDMLDEGTKLNKLYALIYVCLRRRYNRTPSQQNPISLHSLSLLVLPFHCLASQELAAHSAKEELIVYPFVAQLPNGADLYAKLKAEHQVRECKATRMRGTVWLVLLSAHLCCAAAMARS